MACEGADPGVHKVGQVQVEIIGRTAFELWLSRLCDAGDAQNDENENTLDPIILTPPFFNLTDRMMR